MGDGTNPDPPISSGDGDSSEEDDDGTVGTGLDDHMTDPEPEEPEETEEPEEPEKDDSSGTPTGVPVGGAAATGGGSSSPPTPEEPSNEEPEDDDESETDTPDQPEIPEDDTPEQEPEQPEHPEPEEPENPDDHEQDEEGDEDDDDDDEEEQEAQVVIHSDAWDSIAWGIYPVRLQLKEEYGDQVQFDDRLVPVRNFDSPEDQAQYWEKWEPRHGMPVDTEVWTEGPPESTELANRAFAAAREQSIPAAKRFMRRLRVAAIVEGTNIEDRDTLLELARNVGLDTDQLEEDWDKVDLRQSSRELETPKTTIHVDGETITQPGLVTANDVKTPLKRAGLEADNPQPLPGFVDEYGPVAVKEVQQVYDYSHEKALNELENIEEIVSVEYGDATFWVMK